jgi:GNAT superfamily N-acetyltransferase
VDVGAKRAQRRIARAAGVIELAPATRELIRQQQVRKGDVLVELDGAQARADLAHPDKALWLVEDGGVAIGYALAGPCDLPHPEVTNRCLELKRIYFVAGRQGGGLGGRLFDEVMAWMERDGPRDLWIGVWSENFGAQRFYGRRGFEKVGEYGFRVGRTVDHEFILRREAAASTTLDQHRSK